MSSSRRARTYTDSVVYSQSEIFFETTVSKEVPAVQWQTEWEEDNPSATQQPFLQCQVLRVNWKTREPGFDMESSEVKKRKWSEDGFCFAFKAKEIHPTQASPPNAANSGESSGAANWAWKWCRGAMEKGRMKLPVLKVDDST